MPENRRCGWRAAWRIAGPTTCLSLGRVPGREGGRGDGCVDARPTGRVGHQELAGQRGEPARHGEPELPHREAHHAEIGVEPVPPCGERREGRRHRRVRDGTDHGLRPRSRHGCCLRGQPPSPGRRDSGRHVADPPEVRETDHPEAGPQQSADQHRSPRPADGSLLSGTCRTPSHRCFVHALGRAPWHPGDASSLDVGSCRHIAHATERPVRRLERRDDARRPIARDVARIGRRAGPHDLCRGRTPGPGRVPAPPRRYRRISTGRTCCRTSSSAGRQPGASGSRGGGPGKNRGSPVTTTTARGPGITTSA